jgi:pimeloyl-ACP methyl ester carboxylesterase
LKLAVSEHRDIGSAVGPLSGINAERPIVQVKTRREERQPLFFGERSEPLYGCYHPPVGGGARDCAVVLCYPFGQEYIRSHRSFLQLAIRLAGRGFPVLRFDYFGCGDSAGETEQGRVVRWLDDIAAASQEIRVRSRASRLCLAGLRLGGTLAGLAAAAQGGVDSLVLWDPIVSGRAYLDELRALQAEMLRFAYVDPKHRMGAALDEVLGFPTPPELRAELEALDLLSLGGTVADRVLLIESGSPPELAPLLAQIRRGAGEVEHLHVAERRVWLAEPFRGIVPHQLLEALVAWMDRVHE